MGDRLKRAYYERDYGKIKQEPISLWRLFWEIIRRK